MKDAMIQAPELKALNNIDHGFFTRKGGVSKSIYTSLNCGFGSKDTQDNVAQNRTRIAEAISVAQGNLITPYQCHSATAVIADTPWQLDDAPKADAIVTNTPGLAVAILTADCAPVLFADEQAGVVGAAHAGWRGAKAGILQSTVEKMMSLGAKRERIVAVIGPALGQDNYEVGEEFKDSFLLESPQNARFFVNTPTQRPHFDLAGYVRMKIEQTGILSPGDISLCTYADESVFYSYRRSVHKEEADYGRQISAILVKM